MRLQPSNTFEGSSLLRRQYDRRLFCSAIEQRDIPDSLHQLRCRSADELSDQSVPCLTISATQANLDELMALQRAVDFREHRVG